MSKIGRYARAAGAAVVGLGLLMLPAGCRHAPAGASGPNGSAGPAAGGQSQHFRTPAETFSHMKRSHP